METKKSKTGAIIGTLAAVLLCGCPGLFLCLFGALTALGLGTGNLDLGGYSSSGALPGWVGFVLICVSLILILIPVVVGITTLREKKPKTPPVDTNDPVPPPA